MPARHNVDVLILGSSARASAFSALRAGLRPRCLDSFADADLTAACPALAIDPNQTDDELERLAASLGAPFWLYTGPFENRPDLIDRLSRSSRLLGNGAETLRAVRNPWNVAAALTRHGFAAPRLARIAGDPPHDGRWLVKPLASGGGWGVRFWDGEPPDFNTSHYLQEFIDGPTLSALYVAANGSARLLGIARQEHGAAGSPFLYRGSIGPWPVDDRMAAKLARLGDVLASEFGLVGLFGVDFVLADDEPWPIEVNPRYTASVEVLELAAGRALLADHVRACLAGELPEAPLMASSSVVGKRIMYATQPTRFPEVLLPRFRPNIFEPSSIADIPRPGAMIQPGEPVMTVLAKGRDAAECLAELDRLERAWRGWSAAKGRLRAGSLSPGARPAPQSDGSAC